MFDLIATSTFGLEAVVKRELAALGYEDATASHTGRIEFRGDTDAIARTNMFLRSADRVQVRVAAFWAGDFQALFEGVRDLPWAQWIGPDAAFPVAGRSVKSKLTSVPAVQRSVKKAIVESLQRDHRRRELPETGPPVAVEVSLLKDMATLTINTSGDGLHKRGYRDLTGAAPLRETLAAALVALSFYRRDRPLIDPFCGSGTIAIEAALMARRMAPGYARRFAAEQWDAVDPSSWERAREEARDVALGPVAERIVATDIDPSAVSMARRHAERAGVGGDIHFQQADFHDLRSSRSYGSIVTNPPYGERLDTMPEVQDLYRCMPEVFGCLPTWSVFVLTSWRDFERVVGRRADRRRKLYNAQLECTYYQYHGPRPPKPAAGTDPR